MDNDIVDSDYSLYVEVYYLSYFQHKPTTYSTFKHSLRK